MKIAIVSDVHANLAALEAVLADIDAVAPDAELWHCGDLVGYNAEPDECVALLRERQAIGVLGNHDAAALGRIDIEDFNPAAAAAVRWTAGRMGAETRAFLEGLPRILEMGDATLAHGSPLDPMWEYVDDEVSAAANAAALDTRLLFHGHTHVPRLWEIHHGAAQAVQIDAEPRRLTTRALVNAGSVGQPRDRDARACWLLWEHDGEADGAALGHATWRRVPYDVAITQARVRAAGLPEFLATRLGEGR